MRSKQLLGLLIGGLLLCFVSSTPALAIDVYGRIRGIVTDPSGAVVAGATVTVTNRATGIAVTATSATDGSYELLQLPAPSTYDLKCEKSGFKAYIAEHIRLSVTQIYVQNVEMQLGQVTQQVTVEAAPTQVEKTSIELSATIGSNTIVDMPLNGRNWVQLQQTMPGVVAQSDGRGNYATNGSQTDQNSFLVNGVDTNDLPLNTPIVIPNPDAIAEFHMVTNTINPEYGRNSGAILNAVTKSGQNQFHGSGFEFFRDSGLNSRNFFTGKIVYHQHQFGGTVGGPVIKDKTFFFFAYQGTRNRVPQAGGDVTVFSADQRNGLFPDISSSTTVAPIALTGEDGIVHPANSTTYAALFPTGTIPSVDFNPITSGLLKTFVPTANLGSDYVFNPSVTGKADQFISRVDHTFGPKDSLWGSWFYQHNPTSETLPFTGATLPGFGDVNERHTNQFVLTWNHTFGATMLNEARAGYTRFNFGAVSPQTVVDPKSVGFPGINVQYPQGAGYPLVDVLGYFTLGFSTNGPQPRLDTTRQFDDNFTFIHGKHTMKVGYSVRRFRVYNPFHSNNNGTFEFQANGLYTTGDPAADYMLGIPDSYGQGGGDVINARAWEHYSYFQDQFRMRPNLTLTYGVGWSIDTPLIDDYHGNHAMIAWRPGMQSTLYPNAPANYMFNGEQGIQASGTTKYGHFGPRFGFAWSPGGSGKWSIRGGYGIYFNRSLEEQSLQFLGDPPFSIGSRGAADVAGRSPSLANPFTDIAGNGSIPNKFPANPNPPSSVDFSQYEPINFLMVMDPHTSVPYAQNFNLTVERQLPGTAVLSLAYVGALGRKLDIVRELNPGINPQGCLADPACVADRVDQNVSFPNNFPYPGNIVAGIANDQTTGTSNYNSFQATYNKHMSHGLQMMVAYTWSHAFDDGSGFENSAFGGGGFGAYGSIRATNPFNQTAADYGPSAYDARHRMVVSYTYNIPSPRHFENWAAKRFFDGWQMSGITTFQTGFAYDVVDAGFRSLTCDENIFTACWDVPNVKSAPSYVDPHNSSIVNCVKGCTPKTLPKNHVWFDPNTFAREPLGTMGDAGRNVLRGPHIANFDWGFYKDTNITEQTRLQLRFEFFNLFNHTQFNPSGLSTNLNSSNFGRITAARDPRLIQLAAKFYF